MDKASRVMYSIANIFNWVLVGLSLAGIVLSILAITDVFSLFPSLDDYGVGTLIACIVIFLVAIIIVSMVRRAKANGSSKLWDVFFLVCGIIGGNIFYFFGGLFGLIARK